MSVMIVGAGGYLGKRLAASLAADGVSLVALSSSDGTGIDPRTGLLPDDFAVPPGVDTVFYLAQSPFHRGAAEAAPHVMAVNALSPVRVAAAAGRARVGKFIYTSTGNVYARSFEALPEGAPLRRDNWYSLSKVHAEEALDLFRDRMDVTVVRLFGVYGAGQTRRLVPGLIDAVAERREIALEGRPGDGASPEGLRVSLCYVEDVVRMLRALDERRNVPVINVAGDEVLSVRGIASQIGARLGIEPVFAASARARDTDLIADISRLKDLLAPTFTRFADGLERTLAAGGVRRADAAITPPPAR